MGGGKEHTREDGKMTFRTQKSAIQRLPTGHSHHCHWGRLRTTGFQDSAEQLFHPLVPIHLPTAMLLKNTRRWKTGGERNSHANEDLIKRENKGESALIRVPGGGKALTGTGLIKTSSVGSFGKCF